MEGVYTCVVCDAPFGQPVRSLGLGVMSIGPRPTVDSGFTTEVHVFDFSADLYEKRLRVHIIQRLRGIEKFASVDALRVQIEIDAQVARDKLEQWSRVNPQPLV